MLVVPIIPNSLDQKHVTFLTEVQSRMLYINISATATVRFKYRISVFAQAFVPMKTRSLKYKKIDYIFIGGWLDPKSVNSCS